MKHTITILFSLLITFSTFAQRKEKIKGNKEVVDIHNVLGEFNAIKISDDFEVTLQSDELNRYHLETDQNLVDVIKLDITDGELSIYSTHRIQTSKRLNLTIYYQNINAITIMDNAQVTAANRLESDDMTFIALDKTRFELDFDTKNTTINLNGDAKGEIQLKGDKVTVMTSDNSNLKGNFKTDSMQLETKNRSDVSLDGSMNDVTITAVNDTDVSLEKIKANNVNLKSDDNADVHLHASKKFTLYAKGKGNVYLHGTPEIKIDGFMDQVKLIKQ